MKNVSNLDAVLLLLTAINSGIYIFRKDKDGRKLNLFSAILSFLSFFYE